jgi:hypothetical protein
MSGQDKNPPAYVAHRAAVLTIIAVVVLLCGYTFVLIFPGVVAVVDDAIAGLHGAWTRWDWKLF